MIENIYYISFLVIPTKQNKEYDNLSEVTVYCGIKSTDIDSSYLIASFYIEKFDWQIKQNLQKPIIVYEDNFYEKEIELENFYKAQ